ncbi:SitA5 family polymorphic toxin [Cystobacter fuscus]|uniref:SitA5 family polymorphic toxin n=1 Tax=Cystobacter fuscus TaxID=43 RepID=UPI003F65FAB8
MAEQHRSPEAGEGSDTQVEARRRGPPPWASAGALWLIVLIFHAACASQGPASSRAASDGRARDEAAESEARAAPRELQPVLVVYAAEVEAHGRTRVVAVTREEYQRAVAQLLQHPQVHGTPQEVAQGLLQAMPEEELLAEVYRDKVLTLVPLNDKGSLVPEAEAALKAKYLRWCQPRGGGDCLGLFTDGPYLRTDDRRTLALALAFGGVLDETRAALGRELSPQALLSSLVWAVGLYLALWLLPEPSTKAAAAALSVVLLAWLGVDAMWGLMDGWARMAHAAHEATTFEELRDAGEDFGKRIGTDAARALILAVATLTGRTLGEVVTHVRSLPKFNQVQAQWAAQGMEGSVAVAMEEAAAVEVVVEQSRALVVLTSPQAPVAINVLTRSGSSGSSGGRSGTIAIQHRGGNKQVILSSGERWHLPRGKSYRDIPAKDRLGDELQAAVREEAAKWSRAMLSEDEVAAIDRMRRRGLEHRANLLERQARGRWVEAQVKDRFPGLSWNSRGVDITGPGGQSYHYEILSGTESNFALHGRRMASTFFRMIFF